MDELSPFGFLISKLPKLSFIGLFANSHMLRKIVKLANISAPLEFTVAEQLVNEEAKLLKGKQDSALNLYLVLVCVG